MNEKNEQYFLELVKRGNPDKLAKLLYGMYEQCQIADDVIQALHRKVSKLEEERRATWAMIEQ